MSHKVTLTGVVLDEELTLALADVCEICGLEVSDIVKMVQEGVAEPLESSAEEWQFSGIAIARFRTAQRLQRDLRVNLAGAALAIELLEELRSLKASIGAAHLRKIPTGSFDGR